MFVVLRLRPHPLSRLRLRLLVFGYLLAVTKLLIVRLRLVPLVVRLVVLGVMRLCRRLASRLRSRRYRRPFLLRLLVPCRLPCTTCSRSLLLCRVTRLTRRSLLCLPLMARGVVRPRRWLLICLGIGPLIIRVLPYRLRVWLLICCVLLLLRSRRLLPRPR